MLGWRYTRSARASKRNGFISFISAVSMLGISLGVATLIIVLSVMNGFQQKVRDRMLGVISHIEVLSLDGGALRDPAATIRVIKQNAAVVGASPFIDAQALIARGDDMRGVLVHGIDPHHESEVSELLEPSVQDDFDEDTNINTQAQKPASLRSAATQLHEGGFGMILGVELAHHLGVKVGDSVTLIAPTGEITPAGVSPRLKKMQVMGTFSSGHFEYDSNLVLLHIKDAEKFFRLEGPTGIRVKVSNLHDAPRIRRELLQALSAKNIESVVGDVVVNDWTQKNRTYFAAVQVEKTMMFIILTLIVAVAAFNLVSTLVMTVTEKRSDIAILRTLGASPCSIMAIFVVQGAAIGIVGTLVGVAIGLLIAFNIDVIVPVIEYLLQTSFLPRDIYFLSRMPSNPQSSDIIPITVIALVMSFIATLYPSWRASRVNPAEALRYE